MLSTYSIYLNIIFQMCQVFLRQKKRQIHEILDILDPVIEQIDTNQLEQKPEDNFEIETFEINLSIDFQNEDLGMDQFDDILWIQQPDDDEIVTI